MTFDAEKASPAPGGAAIGKRISAADALYGQVLDFLYDEAALLDSDGYEEWLELLTDDIVYRMPVRETVRRKDGKGFSENAFHLNENKKKLGLRMMRLLKIPSAFDWDPAPRIQRSITNVVVHETSIAGEYAVSCCLTLLRNRLDAPTFDQLAGKREDVLRRDGGGFKLARRTMLLDQATLGGVYLNVLF